MLRCRARKGEVTIRGHHILERVKGIDFLREHVKYLLHPMHITDTDQLHRVLLVLHVLYDFYGEVGNIIKGIPLIRTTINTIRMLKYPILQYLILIHARILHLFRKLVILQRVYISRKSRKVKTRCLKVCLFLLGFLYGYLNPKARFYLLHIRLTGYLVGDFSDKLLGKITKPLFILRHKDHLLSLGVSPNKDFLISPLQIV